MPKEKIDVSEMERKKRSLKQRAKELKESGELLKKQYRRNGNKIDKKPRAVSRREGESWARAKGMLFLESSAKTKVGIDEVFNEMLMKIFENPTLLAGTVPRFKKQPKLSAKYDPGEDDSCGC